jgi:hypothetical protein
MCLYVALLAQGATKNLKKKRKTGRPVVVGGVGKSYLFSTTIASKRCIGMC